MAVILYIGAVNPNSYPATVYEPQNHKDGANYYDLTEFIRGPGFERQYNYRCMLEENLK